MYVCMYLCLHVCMYVCMYLCMYACMHVCMHACMYVCMHGCTCMYVCMHAYKVASRIVITHAGMDLQEDIHGVVATPISWHKALGIHVGQQSCLTLEANTKPCTVDLRFLSTQYVWKEQKHR